MAEASYSSQVLFEASIDGDEEKAIDVLSKDVTQLIDTIDEKGMTCLHHACVRGHRGFVHLLLARECSLFIEDQFLKTPLHYACYYQYEDIVKEILYARSVDFTKTPPNVGHTQCVHDTPPHELPVECLTNPTSCCQFCG